MKGTGDSGADRIEDGIPAGAEPPRSALHVRHSGGWMSAVGAASVRFFERWMPDAFVVAVCLTLLTFALALLFTDTTPRAAIEAWGDGLWSLLSFTNQVALTLLLGYGVANTPAAQRVLQRAATLVHSPTRAYVLVCVLGGMMALLSWAIALVGSGILARAVGESCRRRGIRVHYPLLVAAAFSGVAVWHQGLSASIPLVIATPGHFLEAQIGLIPTSQTLFTLWNLATALTVVITLPWVMTRLHPRDPAAVVEIPEALLTAPPAATEAAPATPAERLERSRLLSLTVVGLGIAFLLVHYVSRGQGLTLNVMNLTFLLVGLACAGSLQRYAQILTQGGQVVVPFLLQYPLYGGIATLIASSGIAAMVVNAFVALADAERLPLLGFLSAGLLNLFIPSGGGQWAVQGPIMMSAAQALGADIPMTAMSVALGDQWTNLLHPLFLLPVLALARLSVRQVAGYTFIAMLWSGLIFFVALLLA